MTKAVKEATAKERAAMPRKDRERIDLRRGKCSILMRLSIVGPAVDSRETKMRQLNVRIRVTRRTTKKW